MNRFKKILFSILLTVAVFAIFNMSVNAKSVNVYMFYGKTCPHCEESLEYLNEIKDKYDLKIYKYEVWYNDKNKALMNEVALLLDVNVRGVPFVIIDNTPIFGYASRVTDETYRYHIKMASKGGFVDKVGIKLGIVNESGYLIEGGDEQSQETSYKIKLPIIGNVNLKSIFLPLVSILMGVVDGFNPCAMWVLLFLISTLIGIKDKKRLWILGLTFLITASFVYMAFMVSWLSFAKMISGVSIVRTIIAIVAIVGGAINLNGFANSIGNDGESTVIEEKRRNRVFAKTGKFMHEKSFVLAILGVMLLAFSGNLIKLACSYDFSVLFTSLLAMNDLSTLEYWIYIMIYIFFFMIVDLIIFWIAVKMIQLTGIFTKNTKYSHLISGILMFLIGILLIVKPEWLMFNF